MMPAAAVKIEALDVVDDELSLTEQGDYTPMETGTPRFGNQCSRETKGRTYNVDAGSIKSDHSHQYIDPKTERIDQTESDNSSEHLLNTRNKENTVRELHGALHIAEDGHAVIVFGDSFNLSSKDEKTDTLFALHNALRDRSKVEDDTEDIICTSDEDDDIEDTLSDYNTTGAKETNTEQKPIATLITGQLNEDERVNSDSEAESNFDTETYENETTNTKCVDVCPKAVAGLNERNHKVNSNYSRFTCNLCGDSFSRKSTLTNHMKLHDQEKGDATKTYMSCGVCQKLFSQEQSLALHIQVHTGTQKHACGTCGSTFSRKTDLQRHEMIHTGERPYKCAVCDRQFRLPGELGRHRKIHTGDLACKQCGKTYVRINEFRRHVAKHIPVTNDNVKGNSIIEESSEDTAFTCTLCSNKFSSELNLRNHMVLHERGGHTFRPGSRIKTKLHSTQKKSCEICGIQLSNASNLYKHIRRMHSKECHVTCDLCSKRFNTTDALIRHTWRSHLTQK